MMFQKRSVVCAVIIISLLFSCFFTGTAVSASVGGTASQSGSYSQLSYAEYAEQNAVTPSSSGSITVNAAQTATRSDNSKIEADIHSLGMAAVVIPDNGYASWSFTASADCAYIMRITYVAATESSGNLELGLKIDGAVPFKEVALISMRRIFAQSTDEFEVNIAGNDILPETTEKFEWQTYDVSDYSGYTAEPFVFSLSAGAHTLELTGSRGNVAIAKIEFVPATESISLESYKEKYSSESSPEAQSIILEGERFSYKNSTTVLPQTDRTSPASYPQSPSALKLNTVGASSWKTIGDSLTWEFEVEKAGMYEIAIRYRQNLSDGIFASRKLYIDGEVPFNEASSIRFDYSSGWECEKLSSGSEVLSFYLSEGRHTLTLEAVAGDVSQMVREVDSALNSLNRIYRRIVMITGSSPDTNRDYNFKELIPNELEEMKQVKETLDSCIADIKKQSGASGSYTSTIEKLTFQMEKMTDNPRKIASYLEQFKSNLGALSSWLLSAIEQPLEIDRIYIAPKGSDTPKANAGFFERVKFSVLSFIASYTTDYSTIGQTSSDSGEKASELDVWIQSGRDQGEIIRNLMDSSYTKENNVTVNLKIVPGGTLLQSVLSGISPDVVFDCGETEPVDYALRRAAADFTQFEDFEEYAASFPDAAFVPATLNGGIYGMPQTFGFNMMFYRTDIFEEYGWEVPKTWDELKKLIPSLQYNNMEVGLTHDAAMYAMLLYQNGGELYKEGGKYTNLKSNTCLETFVDMCELFTLYDSPVTFDFANRFRTGEMPIAIQSYTAYNQMIAFAPEIKGLWAMVPVPGTVTEDGSINNVSVGAASYIMIMNTSENKEDAWGFIKWFMSADIQSAYSLRMESLLGNCAKVATANIDALSKMAWSSSEYSNLTAQLKNVSSIPQVPGGYYLSRVLSFAFNRTYNDSSEQTMGEDPAEVLTQYIKEFDEELAHKREEFSEVLQNEGNN